MEPKSPIWLDLSKPMDKPMLLAAGGIGGLGNPHFATRTMATGSQKHGFIHGF
jgi:GTP-binding protein